MLESPLQMTPQTVAAQLHGVFKKSHQSSDRVTFGQLQSDPPADNWSAMRFG